MQVLSDIATLRELSSPLVVSVGNFDGVHRAHQIVLRDVVHRAAEIGGKSVAITFDPHPTRALRPERAPKLITLLEDKLAFIAEQQIDFAVVVPFTEQFAQTSAEDFCRALRDIGLVEIREGANFRFGRGAQADVKRLQELAGELGFRVVVYPEARFRGVAVSSSCIRAEIANGNLNLARHLLGRCFFIRSTPARGRGYGSRYTVPTINLAPYSELLPANGVYVTELEIQGKVWQSVTNVGNRPTFGADSFAIESHILDFEPIALDESTPLKLTFLHRLREERRFSSPEELRKQIGRDVARARRWFALRKLILD